MQGIPTIILAKLSLCLDANQDTFNPSLCRIRIYEGRSTGVTFTGTATKGQLVRCDIARNAKPGIAILAGADPIVAGCSYVPRLAERIDYIYT